MAYATVRYKLPAFARRRSLYGADNFVFHCAMKLRLTRFASGVRRNAVVLMLLLALVLRALVPSGAMAVASSSGPGAFEMVICSANASHKVVVADVLPQAPTQSKLPLDHLPSGHDHNLCGFAATANVALPPVGDLLPPAYVRLGLQSQLPHCDLVLIAAHVGPELGARAPPVAV